MNLQQMPRGWGKSTFNSIIRATEALLPEPQVWVNSRGQIVLDVYLEWCQSSAWVRVDVKTKREGDNGFIFRRVADHPQPGGLHPRDRATALRAYGDMEAMKMGMPWRPRGKL
jgi:hypothetical protein